MGEEFVGAEFGVAASELHRRVDFLPNFLIDLFQLVGVRELGSDQTARIGELRWVGGNGVWVGG